MSRDLAATRRSTMRKLNLRLLKIIITVHCMMQSLQKLITSKRQENYKTVKIMFNKIAMQQITRLSLLFVLLTVYTSCGNTSKKEREGTLTDKKVELEKLKVQ